MIQAERSDCELLTLLQEIVFQTNSRAFLHYDQHYKKLEAKKICLGTVSLKMPRENVFNAFFSVRNILSISGLPQPIFKLRRAHKKSLCFT